MGSSTALVSQATSLISHWPIDWIILGAFAVLIGLDAIRSGSNRAASIALALATVRS
jgi:hypothetical protein